MEELQQNEIVNESAESEVLEQNNQVEVKPYKMKDFAKTKKGKIIIGISGVALIGIIVVIIIAMATPRYSQLSDIEKTAVYCTTDLQGKLKDPSSFEVYDISYYDNDGSKYIFISYRAKNSFNAINSSVAMYKAYTYTCTGSYIGAYSDALGSGDSTMLNAAIGYLKSSKLDYELICEFI